MLLRMLQIFICGLPYTIVETYILISPEFSDVKMPGTGLLMTAAIWSMMSCCWSLATFRKHPEYCTTLETLFSWPGSVFKYLWRLCELSVRVFVISLFAGLYGYWVLLVLSLHWITMFLLGLVESYLWNVDTKLPSALRANIKGAVMLKNIVTSFVHIFCYVNITNNNTRYQFCFYYLIMSLENITLLVLWMLFDNRTHLHVPIAAAIGSAYMLALASAVLYYNCFHLKLSQAVCKQPDTIFIQQCINCRLSCCSKHNMKLQRPLPTWHLEIAQNPVAHRCDILPQFNSAQDKHDNDHDNNNADHYDDYSSYSGQYPYSCSTCDSTIYEEGIYSDLDSTRYTEDTEYSDYIWDDYDVQQLKSPNPDKPKTESNPLPNREGTPERSDSGFSASGSSNSKNNSGEKNSKPNMVFVKHNNINMFTGTMLSEREPSESGSIILEEVPAKHKKHRKFGLPQENTQCHCKTCGTIYRTKILKQNVNVRETKSRDHTSNTKQKQNTVRNVKSKNRKQRIAVESVDCDANKAHCVNELDNKTENKSAAILPKDIDNSVTESLRICDEILGRGHVNYGATLSDVPEVTEAEPDVPKSETVSNPDEKSIKGSLESVGDGIII